MTQLFSPFVNGYYDVAHQTTLDLRLRAREHFARQAKEKAALTTKEEFEAHRHVMRENFLQAIGGLPGPEDAALRPPVEAQVTGRTERETFSVDKLIYESLPGYPVSAALYQPKQLAGPAAAVVMVHGHANDGKAYPFYQAVCIDLVNNGFVVLAIDPVGQGERKQFIQDGVSQYRSCTQEHTHCGIPMWLAGSSIARHFIWDVMRGIDYLAALPEVDASRIGITGSSGGGTQSCYLMMTDPRIAAAMPCTFVMTLESYQKTGQPQDAEQIIPGCMAHGPDHDDLLTAIAPRPVMVGAAAYDFFPIEGALEAVKRARRIYGLYGKAENLDISIASTGHQYSPHLRQACVNWFRRHLQGVESNFVTGEPPLFEESELWATPTGSLYGAEQTYKTAIDLNAAQLPPLPAYPDVASQRAALRSVLRIDQAGDGTSPIHARILGQPSEDSPRSEKLFFLSTPEIAVTGILFHPDNEPLGTPLPATLLLLENGTSDIDSTEPVIQSILQKGHRAFVFDVRGTGALTEYGAKEKGDFGFFNHEYKLACDAMMLGLCLPGLRVFDVLRGVDYLRTRADVSQIHLHGIGSGAFFAFMAAALDEKVASLTCEDMLLSYRELCQTPDYTPAVYNLKTIVRGLLQCGDLPDLMPLLGGRQVIMLRPRNARGETNSA